VRRHLRVLLLVHEDLVPPERVEDPVTTVHEPWKTEYDVAVTLRALGHEVQVLGVASDLGAIRSAIETFNPHIAFNLLEEFHGVAVYDHHVVSYLELLKRRYTGCNPRGLLLAHDKALAKRLFAHHRIRVPEFAVFPMGRKARRRPRIPYPLLVKSLTEEGSVGIAQASVVDSDEALAERVEFVHRHLATDAIAERYVEGREIYVGMLGNGRIRTLPAWELVFSRMPEDAAHIATEKVKWDRAYQERHGIRSERARDLPAGTAKHIDRLCRRAYRALYLTGYARMDLRLTSEGEVYLIEANPNPQLAHGEDFAESAEAAGLSYEALVQAILDLGLRYRAQWEVA
jgi:D-alanine-D-alanine ligase